MVKNTKDIAKKLGAKVVGKVPNTGGGAFGMARLGEILRERLQPSEGQRRGRPSDPKWIFREPVPMSKETREKLARLAKQFSNDKRKVSPMQVAAQLLEEKLAEVGRRGNILNG